MKNEFITAITALAAEKNLPRELVLEAVEAALASAYKKDELAQSNVVVKINTEDGSMRVFTQKAGGEDRRRAELRGGAEERRPHRRTDGQAGRAAASARG
jgi:N utilization substance protein A